MVLSRVHAGMGGAVPLRNRTVVINANLVYFIRQSVDSLALQEPQAKLLTKELLVYLVEAIWTKKPSMSSKNKFNDPKGKHSLMGMMRQSADIDENLYFKLELRILLF